MKKKVTFIFLVAFCIQLIVACCNCPEPTIYQYKFEYVAAFNVDNSKANPIISESPIPRKAYGIKLQIGLRQLAMRNHNKFSLLNQVCAFDCFCGPDTTITPRDTITALKITTVANFNDQYPAGSDVSGLFKLLRSDTYIAIDSVIAKPDIYFTRTDTKFLELYLLTPPDRAEKYSFKIDMVLSNGTQISASTKPIDLE
ncbi:MAG: DUF5034 domain-containing protein [Dyadobacter sp.]|uniref:DUF5034 domain-containing protein n=1 Tax=Dyadobacter sp. TaxID=1914288 RepID=UPI001B16552F|nr:DUF5034 domain-containing protein [Dyadobacter sp.]MBO9614222.1 DUF5034 domain-containing protein [Dyadobacter sp.]